MGSPFYSNTYPTAAATHVTFIAGNFIKICDNEAVSVGGIA
jgi:hypothetical protein